MAFGALGNWGRGKQSKYRDGGGSSGGGMAVGGVRADVVGGGTADVESAVERAVVGAGAETVARARAAMVAGMGAGARGQWA